MMPGHGIVLHLIVSHSGHKVPWLAVWCRRDRMQTPRQHVRVLAVTCGDNGGLRTEILYNEKHKSELLL